MKNEIKYTGRDIGYWRVSTTDQNPEYQIAELQKAGIPENLIFGDKMSGSTMNRPQLELLIKLASKGDCIVVWKLDRLGRSLKNVLETVEGLGARDINIRSLTEQIDTTSPTGRLVMHILLAVAEMERNLISERTRAGMERHRNKGGTVGKPHYIRHYPKRIAEFTRLWESGALEEMTGKQIIAALNKADPKAPQIKVPQVYSNWKAQGWPGFKIPEGDG